MQEVVITYVDLDLLEATALQSSGGVSSAT